MDAPPDSCGTQRPFVDIASHLRSIGLAAPEVLTWDDAAGILVLSDHGKTDFAAHLSVHPDDEAHLYRAAIDTLKVISQHAPPPGLSKLTPEQGAAMLDPAFQWAAKDQSTDLRIQIESLMVDLLQQIDPDPSCLSLRDFHAENLIWRPGKKSTDRVGLLDFQDAFVTHPVYDLASLLRDARRDVDPNLTETLLDRLLPNMDPEESRNAFHVFAVQRNLRILGIFQALAQRDGKTGYLAFEKRVRHHLMTDLAAPTLTALRPLVAQAFDLVDQ